ncbi:MAG: GNAT family N-acetyltransferase [Actinobacteria bacterium]|nr:GNAT family N-acetyltransferase [Actinomycetota bacterium]
METRHRSAAEEARGWDSRLDPLVAVTRGGCVEQVHRGVVAVADSQGSLLGGVGDPETPVLLRSAAKPFQAFALVVSGAADALDLSDEELAVICASHAGEDRHVAVVAGLLERLGLSPDDLACGVHQPFSRSARRDLVLGGTSPSPLQNNCSGKHAGMLGFSLFLGARLHDYRQPTHPVQRAVALSVAGLLDRAPQGLLKGVDGCGVPVLRVTAREGATLFARLAEAADPSLERIRRAMTAHPGLVGGEERFDTRCMVLAPGEIVSKEGAAGVQGMGLSAGADRPSPVGCLAKIGDGGTAAVGPVAGSFLRVWGETAAGEELGGEDSLVVQSLAGADVGRRLLLFRDAELRRREPLRGDAGSADVCASRSASAPATSGAASAAREITVVGHASVNRAAMRFLREEWPAADAEIFGRSYDWGAESLDLVARCGRRVVGVLRAHFSGGVATVNELLVKQEKRGQGIGGRLMGVFETEAVRRGCHKAGLRTPAGARAEGFYRGLGYAREYHLVRHHHGHDFVGLVKLLD